MLMMQKSGLDSLTLNNHDITSDSMRRRSQPIKYPGQQYAPELTHQYIFRLDVLRSMFEYLGAPGSAK